MNSNSSLEDDLKKAKVWAEWMDNRFEVPGSGIRFGLDPLLGLVPGIGDFVTNLFALYPLHIAHKHALPRVLMLRMLLNLYLDYLFGLVPILGDFFDVYFKAQIKNHRLLEGAIRQPGKTRNSSIIFLVFIFSLALFLLISPFLLIFLLLF